MTVNDRIDWGGFFKMCVGMAGMRPADFWSMSCQEVFLALTGFKQFHAAEEKTEPMTSHRMNELMELYPDT